MINRVLNHVLLSAILLICCQISTFGQTTRTEYIGELESIAAKARGVPDSPEKRALLEGVDEFSRELSKNREKKGNKLTDEENNTNNSRLTDLKTMADKLTPAVSSPRAALSGRDILNQVKELEKKVPSAKSESKQQVLTAIDDLKGPLNQLGDTQLSPQQENEYKTKLSKLDADIAKLNEIGEVGLFSQLLSWIPYLIIGLILAGGLITGIFFARRGILRERSEIRTNFSDLRNKNNALGQKIETLNKIVSDLSQQIAGHKADISKLKQSSGKASFDPPPPVESYRKEQPKFPVSVDEYLEKYGFNAIPAKYDYIDGMLVRDASEKEGLLIVQDGGQLLLVPRFGTFQTKNDYTNYFERYYLCSQPMGGNVWIRQPAVVSEITGGWELRSQGELEVK
jgi:hypothetical protein